MCFSRWLYKTLLSAGCTMLGALSVCGSELTYRELVTAERRDRDRSESLEQGVSGVAALAIGLYGYYNDDRGVVVRLIYSASQTAGVYLVSDAIGSINEPSYLLRMDKSLRKNKSMSYRQFRQTYLQIEKQKQKGALIQRAVTTGVLSGMYLYSGYREQARESALRNVYYFLGINMLAISGASFYDYYFDVTGDAAVTLQLGPVTTLTYRF